MKKNNSKKANKKSIYQYFYQRGYHTKYKIANFNKNIHVLWWCWKTPFFWFL